jgi:two-component system cell cycle sensor histidine kinase/response regulator CckA
MAQQIKANPKLNSRVEILIVEDSPTQAAQLQHMLERRNYRVSVATDGREALALIEKHLPTLVISDIVMPEMDGFELCRRIKTNEKLKNIPVVLLTMLSEPEDIIRGLTSGADNFLTKPCDEQVLLSRIHYVLVNRDIRLESRSDMGIEIFFAGQKHFITSNRLQILDLLFSTYEDAIQRSRELDSLNRDLSRTQQELKAVNESLEEQVLERTRSIDHLNKVISAVRNVNQLIVRETDPALLVQQACEQLIATRGFSSAWIALMDESGRVVSTAQAGLGEEFLPLVERMKRGELPHCTRRALAQIQVVAVEDLSTCGDCPLACRAGNMEAMAVRLAHGGKVYGLLFASALVGLVSEEEEQGLLSEVADDIGFALSKIQTEEKRSKAERAVRESEARYKSLFEGAAEGILIADVKTKEFLFANPAICRMLGYTEDELKGMSVRDIHPEEALDHVVSEFEAQARGEKTLAADIPCLRKDGTVIYADITTAPIVIGGSACNVGLFTDITERKLAEEKLSKSEELFRTAFDNATIGKALVAPDGRFLRVNRALCEMLGYSPEEFTSLSFADVTHPDDLEISRECVRTLLAGESPTFYMEKRYLHKEGRAVWALMSTCLLRDADGRPLYFITGLQNITDRKRAEEALRISEAQLSNAMKIAKLGYWEYDVADDLFTFNDHFYSIFRTSAEQVGGYRMSPARYAELFLHPDDRQVVAAETKKALETTDPHFSRQLEHRIIYADGKIGHISVRYFVVKDNEGRTVKTYGANQDITERKSLEEQLLQSQKMEAVGRLAGGIAHDFNNLLTTIIGNADLSLMTLEDKDTLRENLEEIRKAGQRAASLTRQLLAFSRRQLLQPKVLDLNEVVADMEKMLRRLIGEDIDLETVLRPDLGRVKVDPGQIEQVIMNLAVNARDAMPQGGKLTIETANVDLDEGYAHKRPVTKPGPYVMLAISDTGVGMDKEVQSRLFEPFFTTKEKGKGTGLGLATVYGIVKQSGGYIWVYSEPGQGSTFKIYLPRVEEEAEAVREVQAPSARLSGSETVLVVEDDDMVLGLTRNILRRYGYTVLEARNGEEAMRVASEHQGPIQLMLTDVVMPEMSGRQLAYKLHVERPEMKVLYVSGYTDNAIVHHGILDEGIPFLQKPFSPEVLARKVREVLDLPSTA